MAIKGFKKVEDHKGYKLDSKDRQIFERELKESLFGTSATTWDVAGNTDMIEFVLYDTNDNQLPQGDEGRMVRYISLDDTNIQKYFLISEDVEDIKLNGAKEFLVDTEVLIKEAGYSNGIFKTQITLLNRRAGSEIIEHDKLWIHEISPSRTEIRILPVKMANDKVLPDLEERYEVYTEEGQFRDDTISFVQEYVENVNVEEVFDSILKIKGHIKDGQGYINLIKKEFKVGDFGKFILDVKTLFVKAMQYWVENKDSNVNSGTFGHPLSSTPPVSLGIDEIIRKSTYTLTDIIDKLLNKRDILERSTLSEEEQITFDEVQQIISQSISDSQYDSTLPPSTVAQVRGCTDPNAENFNPSATLEDGSCIYPLPPREIEVEIDGLVPDGRGDGRDPRTGPIIRTKTYHIWSEVGTVKYTDVDGIMKTAEGREFEFFTISFIGVVDLIGDVRTYAKPKTDVVRCNDKRAMNFGEPGVCRYNTAPRYDPDLYNDELAVNNTGFVRDDTITRYPITTNNTTENTTDTSTGIPDDGRRGRTTTTPVQEETARVTLDSNTTNTYYTSTRTTSRTLLR